MGGNKHDDGPGIPSLPETPDQVAPADTPTAPDAPQAPVEQPATPTEAPKSVSASIRECVKANLSGSNDIVRQNIVTAYTNAEIERRTKAATSVLEKLEAAELELRKIRPTFPGVDLATGKPKGEPIYTKEQAELYKKTNEQIEKLTKALEKAIVSNDFTKVFELSGK